MAEYRLHVCDLRTDTSLGYVPVQGVTWDDYIGKTGSLSATIPVTDSAIAQRVMDTVLPGRTMLYLERDGVVAWGGILWTRNRHGSARGTYTCEIQAACVESYLRGHRLLLDDLSASGVDQLAIARQIVTYAQAASGGSIGIELGTEVSGILRDRTYSHYDLPYLGGLLDQLGGVDGGFEWRVQVYADAGVRHKVLRLGYPKLAIGAVPMTLDLPGVITAYAIPDDGTQQANAWVSRGASVGSDLGAEQVPLMTSLATTPADIAAGWPRLDGSSDYSSVEDPTILTGHATADLARSLRPVTVPSVSYASATVGQPLLGSSVRLRLRDLWYPDMLTATYRVVGLKVKVEERGGAETTDLYLEAT